MRRDAIKWIKVSVNELVRSLFTKLHELLEVALVIHLPILLVQPSNEKQLSHRSGNEAALQLKIY